MSLITDRSQRTGSVLTKLLLSLEVFYFLVYGYYFGAFFREFWLLSTLTEGEKDIPIDLQVVLKFGLFYWI